MDKEKFSKIWWKFYNFMFETAIVFTFLIALIFAISCLVVVPKIAVPIFFVTITIKLLMMVANNKENKGE